jgi:hypothetical protein
MFPDELSDTPLDPIALHEHLQSRFTNAYQHDLLAANTKLLKTFAAKGTTTLEMKAGHALDKYTTIKLL